MKQLSRFLLPALLCAATSCRKHDPAPGPSGPASQQETNNWILEQMRTCYLWEQSLPASATGAETIAFFNSLKHPGDRFSAIYNALDHSTIPRGMLRTFGMDYYVVALPQGVITGIVNFVIPGTAAAQSGLKRGDYFTRINGTRLTAGNAEQLGNAMLQQNKATITLAKIPAGGQPEETGALSLENRTIVENPLYRSEVWTEGGKHIGYIFLNNFDDYYNRNILQAVQQLKAGGVSELILDLRYNPGGSVTAAALLSALVAPGIDEQQPFVQFTGNARQGVRVRSFKDVLAAPSGENKVIPFSELQPARLQLPRVFILSTGITASAAELMINNLKPYMDVVQIGQTSHGKDVGAVSISDERTPRRIPWVLLPVTFKLANARGEGNYPDGIAPRYAVDEKSRLPLSPVGDRADPLIARALAVITGQGRAAKPETAAPAVLFDSKERAGRHAVVIIPHSP
ncbi:S41 family peptidase [Chitinophaga lutea]|nr:S41 family peptidase [Chitinophaga lutea]